MSAKTLGHLLFGAAGPRAMGSALRRFCSRHQISSAQPIPQVEGALFARNVLPVSNGAFPFYQPVPGSVSPVRSIAAVNTNLMPGGNSCNLTANTTLNNSGSELIIPSSVPMPIGFEDAVMDLPPLQESGEVVQALKRTYQPKVLRRKRTHGFLARVRSRGGRKVINRRRNKGRRRLAV